MGGLVFAIFPIVVNGCPHENRSQPSLHGSRLFKLANGIERTKEAIVAHFFGFFPVVGITTAYSKGKGIKMPIKLLLTCPLGNPRLAVPIVLRSSKTKSEELAEVQP